MADDGHIKVAVGIGIGLYHLATDVHLHRVIAHLDGKELAVPTLGLVREIFHLSCGCAAAAGSGSVRIIERWIVHKNPPDNVHAVSGAVAGVRNDFRQPTRPGFAPDAVGVDLVLGCADEVRKSHVFNNTGVAALGAHRIYSVSGQLRASS